MHHECSGRTWQGANGPITVHCIAHYLRPMRRTFSIVCIALAYAFVLVPDLVHVPALIGHYKQHQEQAPDLNVLEFLALHYADKEHAANGDESHGQLPFHHQHTAADAPPPMAMAPLTSVPESTPPAPFVPRVDTQERPLAGHAYGLLQPPRA